MVGSFGLAPPSGVKDAPHVPCRLCRRLYDASTLECERQVDESDYSLPLALALKAAATAIPSCERKGYPVSVVER
jgi:hypothetical protein